jgi:hypothetical protein
MIIDSGVATGSLQVSGSLSVTGSSNLQGNVRITGSLDVNGSISGAITGSITNAVSASRATSAANADTASFVTLAQTASYVLNAVSASFATTAINAPFYVLTSSFTTASGSISTRVTNLESTASTLTTASASFALVSASYSSASGSLSTRVTNEEATSSTLTAASASFSTRLTTTEAQDATTGSNTFTGVQYISNNTNATTFTSTAAVYTDGGLRVTRDAFISGGLSIAGNLTVFGTSSVNYITSSVLLGLEFLNLNTDLPALRYAGINIGDSGSAAGISSSFWYDSSKDNWLYVYAPPTAGQVTSSLAINGPITYNNVGNEQGLLGNYIVKSQLITADNNHHITSSQIIDDGTTVAIAGNLQVTGSFRAANLTGSLLGSNLVAASVANDRLTNSSVTVTAGTGMSGGGAVALGSSVTLTNAGVTSNVAGTGISVSGATGAVTITNTGVTSNVAGTGVTVSGATGAVTVSIGQAVATSSNVQFNSLGVGTAGSATTGEIRATADITAFFSSDERLKENITRIEDPIAKIKAIDGVTFSWKGGFEEVHSHTGSDTGVIAQQIEAIGLPETVTTRDNGYKAVKYEKLNALLIEGIKAQQAQIDFLQQQLEEVKAILNK